MNKKDRKRKIFEEMRADQPRYDEVTRLLKERVARVTGADGRKDTAPR